jgi:DGQHR domain-containing protein
MHRRKPESRFYLFSLSATLLRRLSGIQRRSTSGRQHGHSDLGIQRRHDERRSLEIARFVRHGFPWSALSSAKKEATEYSDLKKPGWLPTAIVVNVLGAKDRRQGSAVASTNAVTVEVSSNGRQATLVLPAAAQRPSWRPKGLAPLEVIDGQHRLWAFEEDDDPGFELPVVAFRGLDVSWQAYLFWTINIKPTRINPSLAFDLYPLLRGEDWLERYEGHNIYKQARAQEITELLWSYPNSPWFQRINMLGESGIGHVTQAAWIRALTSTFMRSFEGRGVRIGGLYGSPVGGDLPILP